MLLTLVQTGVNAFSLDARLPLNRAFVELVHREFECHCVDFVGQGIVRSSDSVLPSDRKSETTVQPRTTSNENRLRQPDDEAYGLLVYAYVNDISKTLLQKDCCS